jgi:hypothetical protein
VISWLSEVVPMIKNYKGFSWRLIPFVLFVPVLLLAVPLCGQDQGWIQFFANSNGDRFYYEEQSLSFTSSSGSSSGSVTLAQVRFRAVNAREESPIREYVQRIEIDCSKRVYRKLESEIVSKNGSSRVERVSPEWSDIPAESAQEHLIDLVCKKAAVHRFKHGQ